MGKAGFTFSSQPLFTGQRVSLVAAFGVRVTFPLTSLLGSAKDEVSSAEQQRGKKKGSEGSPFIMNAA